jgi:hypothetical protein
VDGPPPEDRRAAAAPNEKDATPLPSFLREAEPPVAEFRKRNVWIPLSFIFLLLGVVIGFQVAVTYRTGRATGLLQEPFKISLSAEKNGENLHVTWDRQSPAVREGQRGVLTILDGSYTTKVDLDWTQLRNPSVFYRHTSPNVRLELAIVTRNKTTLTEALDWKQ